MSDFHPIQVGDSDVQVYTKAGVIAGCTVANILAVDVMFSDGSERRVKLYRVIGPAPLTEYVVTWGCISRISEPNPL